MEDRILNLITSLKNHWKTAPEGRFIPFKEIASLAVGGIGVKFIVYCVSTMILSVGNTLIGNTIGIPPTAIYVIYIISVISGFPLTALRAKMIDSSRSLKGKYRPYIITMGIPTVLLGIGFIWMPYENMSMVTKCIVVLLFNIGFQFFYNFLLDANDSIINVLSPNTIERTDVYAVKSVIENISPSIASIFLPLVAKAITGDNTLYDMRVYRILYPPMLAVGFLVSILIYVNTKERIVQPRNRVVQMSFMDALRAVAGNKYFWIVSLAGWIGFLEGSFGTILGWMYNYQEACSAAQYAVITAIVGNASLWPNLFGPVLIRRYGKKRVLIFSNVMNIIFIAAMLPVVRLRGTGAIWFLLVFIFINQLLTSLGHFMNPSLNADIRDYQQYISGERIDGMFSAVGLIGSVITLATGAVLPMIYEKAGLNAAKAVELGYSADNIYDVLYNADLFRSICSVLIVASVVGATLNVIPFFFYDLTETRQKAMVDVLRIRAYFDDKLTGAVTESREKEAVGILEKAKNLHNNSLVSITKDMSKADKKQARQTNEEIDIAKVVWDEINYFNTDFGKKELEVSRSILAQGVNNFHSVKAQVEGLYALCGNDKELKRKVKTQLRNFSVANATVKNHFPNGVVEFDSSIFNDLFEEADRIENKITDVIEKIKKAKEEKTSFTEGKTKLKELRKQQNSVQLAIKTTTKENAFYIRAVKPYIEAQRCVERYENYKSLTARL